jgi:hypothetical protein
MVRHLTRGALPIPAAAQQDEQSVEVLRLWLVNGAFHSALHTGPWHRLQRLEVDAAWGRVLAEAIQHIAYALRLSRGAERGETVRHIFKAIEAELIKPTTIWLPRLFAQHRTAPHSHRDAPSME